MEKTRKKRKKIEIEKVEEKKVEKKPERKIIEKFVATYNGPQKNIRISPRIGRIMRGIPFKVDRDIAQTLQLDDNFKVEKKYEYVKV